MPELPLSIFAGVPPAGVAALVAIYFAAFFLKGAIGIGGMSATVLFGTMVVGPHHAVLLAQVANLVSVVQFVRAGIRDGDWTLARRIVVPLFLGNGIGVTVFGWIDAAALTPVVGVALGTVALLDMTDAMARLGDARRAITPGLLFALSLVAGILGGITGAAGLVLIALYMRMMGMEPRAFRGTIYLLSTLVITLRLVLFGSTGFITVPLMAQAAALMPVVVAGGLAGARLFPHLTARRFYRLFQGVVLLAAVGLVLRG